MFSMYNYHATLSIIIHVPIIKSALCCHVNLERSESLLCEFGAFTGLHTVSVDVPRPLAININTYNMIHHAIVCHVHKHCRIV